MNAQVYTPSFKVAAFLQELGIQRAGAVRIRSHREFWSGQRRGRDGAFRGECGTAAAGHRAEGGGIEPDFLAVVPRWSNVRTSFIFTVAARAMSLNRPRPRHMRNLRGGATLARARYGSPDRTEVAGELWVYVGLANGPSTGVWDSGIISPQPVGPNLESLHRR